MLKMIFPGFDSSSVTTTAICKYEELRNIGIARPSFKLPPFDNTIDGKSRSIVAGADKNTALISLDIIDSIRDTNTIGIASKIMIVDIESPFLP